MYLVTCPKCNRDLKMNRQVHEAKMKCRYCGGVFVGSTRVAQAPSGPGPAAGRSSGGATRPDAGREHVAPPGRRKKRPIVSLILTAIALVGVAIGAFVLKGQLEKKGYLPSRPGEQEASAPASAPAIRIPAEARPPGDGASPPGVVSAPTTTPAEAGDDNNGNEAESTVGVTILPIEKSQGSDLEFAMFAGKYRNDFPFVLKWVEFHITVTNAEGQIRRLHSGRYESIPPGWKGRFSIQADFRLDAGMKITSKTARWEQAEDAVVGWALGGFSCDRSGGRIKITGLACNPTKRTLKDVTVRCDFFTKHGIYVGSTDGVLHGRKTVIAPGRETVYNIAFDPSKFGYSAPLLEAPRPRLIGRKSEPQ